MSDIYNSLFGGGSFFDANAPASAPTSYQALEMRRKIAAAIMARRSAYPKNIGEGLTALGEGLANRARLNELDRLEAARQKSLEETDAEIERTTNPTAARVSEVGPEEAAPSITAAATPAPAPTPTPTAPSIVATQPPQRAAVAPAPPPDVGPTALANPPIRDQLAAVMSSKPQAGATIGMDQSVEFGGGPPAPAGPVGRAPNQFVKPITNPATGNTLNIPTQPPPNRFTSSFGPVPNVPNAPVVPDNASAAIEDALSYAPNPTMPVRMAAVQPTGNPPTPTTIPQAPPPEPAPVRTAEAGGLGTIPAPNAPLQPEAAPPSYGRAPTAPTQFRTEPQLPDPTPIGQVEALATRKIRTTDDPEVQRRWGEVLKREQATRQFKDTRNVEQWKAQMETFRADYLAKQARAAEEPEKRLKQQQDEFKFSQEKQQALRGIPDEKQLSLIDNTYKEARPLAGQQLAVRGALKALPKMIVGSGSTATVNVKQLMDFVGFPTDPRLDPTQQFQAYTKVVAGSLAPQVAGAGPRSDKDMLAIQQAAAGDINLQPGAIKTVLETIERLNTTAAQEHQRRLLTYAGDLNTPEGQNRARSIYNNYGLPMTAIVPDNVVTIFKNHYRENKKEALDEIDREFHTPGLGQALINSGR